MNPVVTVFPDREALAGAVAQQWLESAVCAERDGRLFSIALSGGGTPGFVYRKLAAMPSVPWRSIHLFWGDERCVPPDHAESNYRMVREALLDRVSIPEENIHRIRGEEVPEDEALRYAEEIKKHLVSGEDGIPRFDWILLGLGTDGHTASIFPGAHPAPPSPDVCRVTLHPQSGQKRITLGADVLNGAERVLFLVTGKEKAGIVGEILGEGPERERYPAGRVQPREGTLQWFLDAEAGALLK